MLSFISSSLHYWLGLPCIKQKNYVNLQNFGVVLMPGSVFRIQIRIQNGLKYGSIFGSGSETLLEMMS